MSSHVEAARPAPRNVIRSRFAKAGSLVAIVTVAIILLTSSNSSPRGPHDELFAYPHSRWNATGAVPNYASASNTPSFSARVEGWIDRFGTTVLAVFGVESDAEATEGGAYGGGGLASWSESSVFVELSNSLHPSRPSAFGPHLVAAPLRALLYPITALTTSDEFGCASNTADNSTRPIPAGDWVALTQRGHCPFSTKVRHAMAHGASAVLFGDLSGEEGGLGGMGGGLLTPWSPDDTDDITIPSAFVSRASYLSLLKTWNDLQDGDELQGLVVVLSKDELFAWPLLDFLLLLLFLPSLLTLLTVVTHRVRQLRQRKADRAPRDVVAGLPVFVWGAREGEKRAAVAFAVNESIAAADESLGEGTSHEDEETSVGMPIVAIPTESTSLLRPNPPPSRRLALLFRLFPRSSPPPAAALSLSPPAWKKYVSFSTECSICLCEFEDGDRVTELPCGHLFHQEEIESWLLGTKRVCPVCRASVTGEAPPLLPPSPPRRTLPPIVEASPIVITPPVEPAPAPRDAGASPVASSSLVTIEAALAEERT